MHKATDMPARNVTGHDGLALIEGRELHATNAMSGEYRTGVRGLSAKPGGRIEATYRALRDGPRTGHALFDQGNWMPNRCKPMSATEFRAHLRWMVRESRLHVVHMGLSSSVQGESEQTS